MFGCKPCASKNLYKYLAALCLRPEAPQQARMAEVTCPTCMSTLLMLISSKISAAASTSPALAAAAMPAPAKASSNGTVALASDQISRAVECSASSEKIAKAAENVGEVLGTPQLQSRL